MPLERREQQEQKRIEETSAELRIRESSSTKLVRIAELAAKRPRIKMNNLAYLLNEEFLRECHESLSGKKAVGIDEITKEEYGRNLNENLKNLIERMKRQAYKPQPAKIVEIPKENGKIRKLGIACYEDKIVQLALYKIINAIYSNEFSNCSYGFREGLSCHDALKAVNDKIMKQPINYVVEIDVEKFFDTIDHKLLMKAVEFRIGDNNVIRILWRMLKAGALKDKVIKSEDKGTPQGSIISPLLANIFMHWAIDNWFEKRKANTGITDYVRYADDMIFMFQFEKDAVKFFREIKERFNEINLKMNEEKSRIVKLNKYQIGTGEVKAKSENTFDFLGFSHYIGLSLNKKPRLKRRTKKKTFQRCCKAFKYWIKSARNVMKFKELIALAKSKIRGHYQYYGVNDNYERLEKFGFIAERSLYRWLNKRSQRKSFNWEDFRKILKEKLNFPQPKIYCNLFG